MKRLLVLWGAALCLLPLLQAHTLFLKRDTFFIDREGPIAVRLLNGDFERSENTIDRDRMTDVSIVGPSGNRQHPGRALWFDRDPETILEFEASGPGTYLIGVSTSSSLIELSAGEFNEYLEHDGILDVLELRRREERLGEGAVERYSKHVKAVMQSGESLTSGYSLELGYPVEIVPLQNPYSLRAGGLFRARILKEGAPLAGQLVYAGFEPSGVHGNHEYEISDQHHGETGGSREHSTELQARSDSDGIVEFRLSESGLWYIRFINMVVSDAPGIDYQSNWATLTFEVRQ